MKETRLAFAIKYKYQTIKDQKRVIQIDETSVVEEQRQKTIGFIRPYQKVKS